jgi:hypothetical protein
MSEEAPMYVYATEMVYSYYSLLNIKGKSILTVCGSGDQVINAYLLGAKKVVAFDLNRRVEFITKLKLAAIEALNYEEFLDFFGKNMQTRGMFNYSLYKRIKKGLDPETSRFFDRLYKEFRFKGDKLAASYEYFRTREEDSAKRTKLMNGYLKNESSYLKARERIHSLNLEFIPCDVQKLIKNKKLKNKKFDIINLSNVPDYITRVLRDKRDKDPFKHFINGTISPLFKLVAKGGLIFYYHNSPMIYRTTYTRGNKPPAAEEAEINRREFRKRFAIKYKKFEGVSRGTRDRIVIFRRLP